MTPFLGSMLFGIAGLCGFALLFIWVLWRESPPPAIDDYPHEHGDGS